MAHTTERAILVLCAHPNLITAVQAITADVDADIADSRLVAARELLERFPAKVQHAATMRSVIVPRRLAILSSVRAAQIQKYGEGGQAEPVSPLLELLADAPGDILRFIVEEFVGEGFALERTGEENEEKLEGERRAAAGRKRGREE